MSPFHAASALTSVAFLAGIALVLLSIQYQHMGPSIDNHPVVSSDDMGTSGAGFPSDAQPSATSAVH